MLLGWPAAGRAQETSGDIRGRLLSPGGVLAEAEITATGPDLLGRRRSVSAGDGVFVLLALPPGTYTLRVAAIGYRALVLENVPVRLGRTTGLGDVAVELASVALDPIIVTAPRLTLDPVHTTIGATLESTDYAGLPGERDYTSLIAILPFVNTSYHGDPPNAAGSTGLENMYFIDGVNVTAPLDAATSTTLPYNFVRSVEVRVGGYEAQYGRALGAVVNAVTYTGGNDFEADAFGFVTHHSLHASPRAQPVFVETGGHSYDAGVRVSGPVVRDRVWFSAAWNPRQERADKQIGSLGTFRDERTAQIFAGKLTWRPGPAGTVELSVFGDPTTWHRVREFPLVATYTPLSPGPFLERLETGGVSVSLRSTGMLGRWLMLEGAAARIDTRNSRVSDWEPDRMHAIYTDYIARTIDGGIINPTTGRQGRTSLLLRGTHARGRHTVVLGAEYEDTHSSLTVSSPGGGVLQHIRPTLYTADSQVTSGTVHGRVITTYLQDAWRATGTLTVSAGLRWSGQSLVGASGRTAQRFPDEWQPRLGFSWQLDRSGSQRFFGSYGRYFLQEPLSIAAGFYVDAPYWKSFYSVDPRQPGARPDSVWDLTRLEAAFARSVPDLEVENYDEVTLGYERRIGGGGRLTVRALRRALRSSFQVGRDPSLPGLWVIGTPGEGSFAFLPRPRREFTALAVSVNGGGRLRYDASYVLSRTWGNFIGLYDQDSYGLFKVGSQIGFNMPHQAVNSTGLLPGDRPHVFKLVTTWRALPALTVGSFLTWQSGTPVTEFGAWAGGPLPPAFVTPRGSAGRTPSIWDLNLRVAWGRDWGSRVSSRLILDLLHVGNSRATIRVDEQHYTALVQGVQSRPNPTWLQPTAFQPPRAARLGLEVSF